MLWFAVVAFVALGLWQILEAVAGTSGDAKDRSTFRAKSAGKAVVYLALGALTFQVVSGSGGGGSRKRSRRRSSRTAQAGCSWVLSGSASS